METDSHEILSGALALLWIMWSSLWMPSKLTSCCNLHLNLASVMCAAYHGNIIHVVWHWMPKCDRVRWWAMNIMSAYEIESCKALCWWARKLVSVMSESREWMWSWFVHINRVLNVAVSLSSWFVHINRAPNVVSIKLICAHQQSTERCKYQDDSCTSTELWTLQVSSWFVNINRALNASYHNDSCTSTELWTLPSEHDKRQFAPAADRCLLVRHLGRDGLQPDRAWWPVELCRNGRSARSARWATAPNQPNQHLDAT